MIEYRLYGKCGTLESVPSGAKIIAIDDQEVIAQCENCGKYICDEKDYGGNDQEGIYLCKTCWEFETLELNSLLDTKLMDARFKDIEVGYPEYPKERDLR